MTVYIDLVNHLDPGGRRNYALLVIYRPKSVVVHKDWQISGIHFHKANRAKDATKPQNMRKNSLSKSLPPGVQKKREKLVLKVQNMQGLIGLMYHTCSREYYQKTHIKLIWVITFSPTSNVHFLIVWKNVIARDVDVSKSPTSFV